MLLLRMFCFLCFLCRVSNRDATKKMKKKLTAAKKLRYLRCGKLAVSCLMICNGGLKGKASGSMGYTSHPRGSKVVSHSNATGGSSRSQILKRRQKRSRIVSRQRRHHLPVIWDPSRDFRRQPPRLPNRWPELVLER